MNGGTLSNDNRCWNQLRLFECVHTVTFHLCEIKSSLSDASSGLRLVTVSTVKRQKGSSATFCDFNFFIDPNSTIFSLSNGRSIVFLAWKKVACTKELFVLKCQIDTYQKCSSDTNSTFLYRLVIWHNFKNNIRSKYVVCIHFSFICLITITSLTPIVKIVN